MQVKNNSLPPKRLNYIYLQLLEVCNLLADALTEHPNLATNECWIRRVDSHYSLHTSKVFSKHLFQRKQV